MRRCIALLLLFALFLPEASLLAQASEGPATPPLTLQPGDVVRVSVYREEDLDGEFLVDESGVVVLPLIGEQQVSGIPLREVRTRLLAAYRAHLRNPSITITPLRRINVLGEVQKPGMYAVDPTVSLAGAVALAGGVTSNGDMRRIRIIRENRVIRKEVGVASTLSAMDIRSGDQIVVDQRNWLTRNSTFVVSALLTVASVVSSIIIAKSNADGDDFPTSPDQPAVERPDPQT